MQKISIAIVIIIVLTFRSPAQTADRTARYSEEWIKKGIIYEIYPRAFSPEGTFAGIEKKLPDLKKLGVTILWLMPIHPIGEEKRKGTLGSPYSIKDYYGINPEYGTLDDFKRLVSRSHEFGFKIIIDLVANHTSWDSKMFNEHPEWFTKDSSGKFVAPVADWSDVVDLNYDNPDLRFYMISMLKYWVRDIGIDGYRCDVAEMVPTDFWEEARAALDSIKPIIMLAEGQYPEHHRMAFDVTYSWNFYHTLAPVLRGKRSASEFDSILIREHLEFPRGSIRMRFTSNHDENAWDMPDVEKFGADGAKLAAVLAATYPGIPLLYNGQEAGNSIKLGLFEKFEIPWKADKGFFKFYSTLFAIRSMNPSLTGGEYQYVKNNRSNNVYSFIRTNGNNTVLAVYNCSNVEQTVQLDLPKIFSVLKFTNAFTKSSAAFTAVKKMTLPKYGFRLFVVQ